MNSNKLRVLLSACLCIVYFARSVSGGNVLMVTLVASHSHHIWNRQLALGLVERGHNVTMFSHDKEKKPTANFTVIHLDGVYEEAIEDFEWTEMEKQNYFQSIKTVFDYFGEVSKLDLKTKSKELQQILNYPKTFKFDLIIWDINSHQCLYPLIDILGNPPVVAVSPYGLQPYMYAFEYHQYPSYIPTPSSDFIGEMAFFQRVLNTVYALLPVLYRPIYMAEQTRQAKSFFGNNIRPLEEIEADFVGMLLINNDPILDYPHVYPPNIIQVGGLQVQEPKPLQEDLLKIFENAKDGVVYFSLGSNVPPEKLGDRIIKELLAAFSRLKQTVIWKIGIDLDNLPSNVIVRKWLPQNDILGHPKTKLFFTHSGGLSTQETIYHGVPVLCLPFFVDQISNSKRMTDRQMGRAIKLYNLTADIVYREIMEVIDNPM